MGLEISLLTAVQRRLIFSVSWVKICIDPFDSTRKELFNDQERKQKYNTSTIKQYTYFPRNISTMRLISS